MRLNAIDTDELKIISTVLKDGLIEVSDVKYLPSIRSFVAMITRFMWEEQAINKINLRTSGLQYRNFIPIQDLSKIVEFFLL